MNTFDPRGLVVLAAGALMLAGCPTDEPEPEVDPEPLDLPADPAAFGVPVGVTTVTADDVTFEVWYPAPDSVDPAATESIDLADFIGDSVAEVLGEVELPQLAMTATRDVPLRLPEQPYPVLIFSHGFGGFRYQSVDYTTHMASRGYVVLAADHDGRWMPDLLPCLFSPPLQGCDLAIEDRAPDHVDTMLDWLADAAADDGGLLEDAIDLDAIGMSGHSAGGVTTTTMGMADDRIAALMPMAGAGSMTADVPALIQGGSCDMTFELAELDAAYATMPDARMVEILGAGHLAFSNICDLGLEQFAEIYLEPRDDINGLMYDQLLGLAIDGCPGNVPDPPPTEDCTDGWLDLAISTPIINHYATVWFDQQLYGIGDGVMGGVFDDAVVR